MAKKKKKQQKSEDLDLFKDEEVLPSLSPEEIEASAEELCPDGDGVKRRKAVTASEILRIVPIVLFASIFVVCIVMLIQNISGKIKGDSIYEEASKQFEVFIPGESAATTVLDNYTPMDMGARDNSMQTLHDRLSSGHTDSSQGHSQYSEQLANMRASLSSLRDVNKEVFGWIYVPDTKINYPILKGKDNDYYLDHAYNGEPVPIGSIFADFICADKLEDNYNLVLYGHNVTTGQMFHDMTNFLKKEVFDNNLIYIYTMEGIYVYKCVAIYPTTTDNYYYKADFSDEGLFLNYANNQIKYSKHNANETFKAGDKMLTLSTCTNGAQNGRYALHAKLIDIIK